MREFESAEIKPADDGTYSITFEPYEPPKEGKDGSAMMGSYGKRKTATANSLDEALAKIKSLAGNKNDNGKNPEKDMNRYFNGPEKDAEAEEE
jgi:hypothetical protein